MTDRIILAQTPSYDQAAVAAGIAEILDGLGGIDKFVQPGERVLLKPNMLEGLPPERAVTTHPEVVRALIRTVRQAGAIPLVGDSPGHGGTRKVAAKCGILAVCEEEGVELLDFAIATEVAIPQGTTVKKLLVAKAVFEVDKIVSIAKMKTHSFTTITGAVKNLFGCIVGADKAQFHLRMKRRDHFAGMLVDLARLISPMLFIVDGVVGMEGKGPRNGDPKQVGLLLGGTNGFAVDLVMARVMGFEAEKMPVAAQALKLGLVPPLTELELTGSGSGVRTQFAPPLHMESLESRLPGWIVNVGQNQLTARPEIEDHCVGCGRCVEHCPPQAMKLVDGRPKIDYKTCIRCYCCQELCPHNAVQLKSGLVLKAAKRLLG
ncbi:MAG: DUF362 domain-containing protein [Negativicutes bacterium]|nr:DUF362 domain-containing protein [Negativicutes bacterium]